MVDKNKILVRNTEDGTERILSLAELREQIVNKDDDWKKTFEIFTADGETPLSFVGEHIKEGDLNKHITAHVKAQAGYAGKTNFFGEKKKRETLKQATLNGRDILLNLNLNLSYRNVRFKGAAPRDDWMRDYQGNTHSVPITSVKSLIKTILKVAKYDPLTYKQRIFASYGGGILPYSSFFIGTQNDQKRENSLRALFNNMTTHQEGTLIKDDKAKYAVNVGFPRLLYFVPTEKMRDGTNKGRMKGNFFPGEENAEEFVPKYYDQLRIPGKAKATSAFNRLKDEFRSVSESGVFILACPQVPDDPQKDWTQEDWNITNWVIVEIEDRKGQPVQICPPLQENRNLGTLPLRSEKASQPKNDNFPQSEPQWVNAHL